MLSQGPRQPLAPGWAGGLVPGPPFPSKQGPCDRGTLSQWLLPTLLPRTVHLLRLHSATMTCSVPPSALPLVSAGHTTGAQRYALHTGPALPTAGPVHTAEGWWGSVQALCRLTPAPALAPALSGALRRPIPLGSSHTHSHTHTHTHTHTHIQCTTKSRLQGGQIHCHCAAPAVGFIHATFSAALPTTDQIPRKQRRTPSPMGFATSRIWCTTAWA